MEHFVGRCNHELSARLEALGDDYRRLPVRERIRVAVRERLGMIAPYVDSWPQVGRRGGAQRRSLGPGRLVIDAL